MNVRNATLKDLPIITEIESKYFPKAEAASESDFRKRLSIF